MSENNQKVIPKFKKKLQGFLSDESGKITKEDVLKMSIVAMGMVGMVSNANASAHGNVCNITSTTNTVSFGVASGNPTSVDNYYAAGGDCPSSTQSHLYGTVFTNPAIAPYSLIVNGHANGSAGIQGAGFNGGTLTTVSSHGSHGSHGAHGSHGQW